jgi:DNA repair exonuclease SbcCD ATPase subunit
LSDYDTRRPYTRRPDETPEQRREREREYRRLQSRIRRGTPGALDAPPRPYVRREITAEELAAPPGAPRRRRGVRTPTEQWLAKLRKLWKAVEECKQTATRYSNHNAQSRIEHRKELQKYESDLARLSGPDSRAQLRRPVMLPPIEETPEQVAIREAATAAYDAHVALHPDLAEEYENRLRLQRLEREHHRAVRQLNAHLTKRIARVNNAYRDADGRDPLAVPLPPGHPDAQPNTFPLPSQAFVTEPKRREPSTAALARLTDRHDRLLGLRRRLTQEHEQELEHPSRSLAERNRLQLRLNAARRKEETVGTLLNRARWRYDEARKEQASTATLLEKLQYEVEVKKDCLDRFHEEVTLPDPPRAPLLPPRNATKLETTLIDRARARRYEAEAYPVTQELLPYLQADYALLDTTRNVLLARRYTGRRVKSTTVLLYNRASRRQVRVLTSDAIVALLRVRPHPPVVAQVPSL